MLSLFFFLHLVATDQNGTDQPLAVLFFFSLLPTYTEIWGYLIFYAYIYGHIYFLN